VESATRGAYLPENTGVVGLSRLVARAQAAIATAVPTPRTRARMRLPTELWQVKGRLLRR
jgi:hypothetical protein